MTNKTVLSDAAIQQAAQCLVAEAQSDGETVTIKNVKQCLRNLEQALLQSPEIQQLRKDAERYQVLRNSDYQMLESDPVVVDDCFNTFFGEDLDAAVDALKARRYAAMEVKP